MQVYTVDIANQTAVREVVYKVLTRKKFEAFIPHEFTQQVGSISHTVRSCTLLGKIRITPMYVHVCTMYGCSCIEKYSLNLENQTTPFCSTGCSAYSFIH